MSCSLQSPFISPMIPYNLLYNPFYKSLDYSSRGPCASDLLTHFAGSFSASGQILTHPLPLNCLNVALCLQLPPHNRGSQKKNRASSTRLRRYVLQARVDSEKYFKEDGLDSVRGPEPKDIQGPKHLKEIRETMGRNSVSGGRNTLKTAFRKTSSRTYARAS